MTRHVVAYFSQNPGRNEFHCTFLDVSQDRPLLLTVDLNDCDCDYWHELVSTGAVVAVHLELDSDTWTEQDALRPEEPQPLSSPTVDRTTRRPNPWPEQRETPA